MATERVTLPIEGLGCGGGGALTVERALTRQSGVTSAYVNPATEMAYIQYDPEAVSLDQIGLLVIQAGFRAGRPRVR